MCKVVHVLAVQRLCKWNTSADLDTILTSWTTAAPCDRSLVFNASSTRYLFAKEYGISSFSNWALMVGGQVTNVTISQTAPDSRLFQLTSSNLVARGLAFEGNGLVQGNGGCIYVEGYSSVTLVDCQLRECRANFQGGALSLEESQTVLNNTLFEKSEGGYSGGAISLAFGSNALVAGSAFTNNSCPAVPVCDPSPFFLLCLHTDIESRLPTHVYELLQGEMCPVARDHAPSPCPPSSPPFGPLCRAHNACLFPQPPQKARLNLCRVEPTQPTTPFALCTHPVRPPAHPRHASTTHARARPSSSLEPVHTKRHVPSSSCLTLLFSSPHPLSCAHGTRGDAPLACDVSPLRLSPCLWPPWPRCLA